jgi:tRNA A64-2'-O-ribosylphosphate transferase
MTTETCGALNRLKSIFYDAESVSKTFSNWPDIEIIANLRAGKWYCSDPSVKTCYFKSTDGHNGKWDFNTRRLNIPLLETLLSGNAVMIVDATANRRKVYPDALSKTIPIWIYVMNQLISSVNRQQLSAVKLPRFISETEKANLLEVLSLKSPEWLHNLQATLDESTKTRIQTLLKTNGVMQLVPMFLHCPRLYPIMPQCLLSQLS